MAILDTNWLSPHHTYHSVINYISEAVKNRFEILQPNKYHVHHLPDK